MIEIHGLGIRRIDVEPVAMVGLVVDLSAGTLSHATPKNRQLPL